MAFITREPNSFLSIRLTNVGRRMLSLGKLTFSSAVLSDREIDYRFGTEIDYDHSCNRVLTTVDDAPPLPLMNFDGTPPISLDGNVYSDKKVVTAVTSSYGIFSASSAVDSFSGYVMNQSLNRGAASTTTAQLGGDNTVTVTGTLPNNGVVVFTGLQTRFGTTVANAAGNTWVPTNALWYRYSATSSTVMTLDRPTASFDATSPKNISLYFLPWSGSDSYYGTGTTESPVWNLNIVRTSTEIGTPAVEMRYVRYGSIEFAGVKHSFGFDTDTRAVGFVHYSNSDTGNTFGEQFIPKNTTIDLPLVMWHGYRVAPAQGMVKGVRFTDTASEIHYDHEAGTPYTLLKGDSNFGGEVAVGRVYFKLRIIALTDQELLTALSYKSNRNWTLPPLSVSLVKDPKPPLSNLSASGMCESGKTYYVTYRAIMDQPISATSYGYAPIMHCNYVQRISGYTDSNGYSYYLSAKFPALSFPYLRGPSEFTTFSGFGWTCNKVQLLVAKVDNVDDRGVGFVPTDSWRAVSDLTIGGNGIVSGSSGSALVDPSELVGHQFIASNEDYVSGSTYDLSVHHPGFFTNTDYNVSPYGLTYGNETVFPGVIKTVMAATVFKTTWKVVAADTDFNGSLNSTFDGTVNNGTYVTEIGIFDAQGQMVGVAKPTWPIKKSQSRYLTFELELDF